MAPFLAAWISFHPFQSLAEPPPAVTARGDLVNQLTFSGLFLSLAAWVDFHNPERLLLLLRPTFVLLCLCSVRAVGRDVMGAGARGPALRFRDRADGPLRNGSSGAEEPASFQRPDGGAGAHRAGRLLSRRPPRTATCRSPGDGLPLSPNTPEAGAAYSRIRTRPAPSMVLFIFIGLFVARMRKCRPWRDDRRALGDIPCILAVQDGNRRAAAGAAPLAAVVARVRRPMFAFISPSSSRCCSPSISSRSVRCCSSRCIISSPRSCRMRLSPAGPISGSSASMPPLAQRPLTGYGFSTFFGTEEAVYGLGEKTRPGQRRNRRAQRLSQPCGDDRHSGNASLPILWVVVFPIVDF